MINADKNSSKHRRIWSAPTCRRFFPSRLPIDGKAATSRSTPQELQTYNPWHRRQRFAQFFGLLAAGLRQIGAATTTAAADLGQFADDFARVLTLLDQIRRHVTYERDFPFGGA